MPKQQGRLTRRGRIWFGYVYENGLRKQVNTHCTDRQAALVELRRLEQEAADPRKAAAARTTLRQVLEMLVERLRIPLECERRRADPDQQRPVMAEDTGGLQLPFKIPGL